MGDSVQTLIERLRFCADEERSLTEEELLQAADALVSLREENEKLRERIVSVDIDGRTVRFDKVAEADAALASVEGYAERVTEERDRYKQALTEIAGQGWVENCLDPQWAARIAREALGES